MISSFIVRILSMSTLPFRFANSVPSYACVNKLFQVRVSPSCAFHPSPFAGNASNAGTCALMSSLAPASINESLSQPLYPLLKSNERLGVVG